MEAPKKPGAGRPTINPEQLKRGRALSFTDAEYAKLGELAKAAKLGRSEYIIDRLGLDK
jgi:endonuclease YncB( thermonuclease family)